MNQLRLCRHLYSNRMKREIVLVIQLILMALFAFIVFSPVDSFFRKEIAIKKMYEQNLSSIYHFSPGNAIMEANHFSDKIEEYLFETISSVPNVDKVMRYCQKPALLKTRSKDTESDSQNSFSQIDLIIYSKEYREIIDLQLHAGSFEIATEGALPIVIGKALSSQYPIGSVIQIRFDVDSPEIKCVVSGIIDEKAVVPTIKAYGSYPTLDVLGMDPIEFTNSMFAICCYQEEILKDVEWTPNYLLTCIDEDDSLIGLQNAVGTVGTIQTVNNLMKQSFSSMLLSNRWNIFAFTLLSLVALFGFGGYVFLLIRKNQPKFAVFYILGITQRQLTFTIFAACSMPVFISIVIARCLFPWVMLNVFMEVPTLPGVISYLFCSFIFVMSLAISIISGAKEMKKYAALELFRRDD